MNILKIIKSNKFQKIIQIFFTLIIIFNIGGVLYSNKATYIRNYWGNFPNLEKIFLSSQYVNKHPKGFIPDEMAFSYAAGKLIKGTNPVLVVPDAPPLGKYIIGLSTIIFNNDAVLVAFSGILSLVVLYFLGFQIFKSKTLALIPPLFLSFEPIFKNQFIYTPLLDLFQMLFLICGFYFFNKGLNSKKSFSQFIIASLFLGLFISTKFFITGLIIIAASYFVLLSHKQKDNIIRYTMTLPLAVFILLFSYIRVFAFGYDFHRFLGIQKWVFLYHQSFLILPLSIWPLLLLNKWYVWFGNKPVISDPQWLITWPVITILSIITIILYLIKKIEHNKNIEILMAWFVFYIAFFSIGEISSRYFVILIPILYIISLYGVVSLYKIYKK